MSPSLKAVQLFGAVMLLIAIPISMVLLNVPESAQLSTVGETNRGTDPQPLARPAQSAMTTHDIPEIHAYRQIIITPIDETRPNKQ